MRICFFSTLKGSPWGGSEELWASACSQAISGGHETLISRYEWDTTPPKLASLLQEEREDPSSASPPQQTRPALPAPQVAPAPSRRSTPTSSASARAGAYECAGHRSARPLLKWLKRVPVPAVNIIQFNSEDASPAPPRRNVRLAGSTSRVAVNAFVAQGTSTSPRTGSA